MPSLETKNTKNSSFCNLFFNFSNFLRYFSANKLVISLSLFSILFNIFPFVTLIVNSGIGNGYNSPFMIVTNLRGINVRNRNCNIVGRIGAGEILERGQEYPQQIKCKIGGSEMLFVNYWSNSLKTAATGQFVAADFIQKIFADNSIRNKKLPNLVIKNEIGANLRNANCQKIMRVPNKTVSSKNIITEDNKNVCKVGSEFYMMESFIYQNRNYYVAQILTKYE